MAQFSNSLNIGESLSDAVNISKLIRRPSGISMRALLAVHVTSMSWHDFLLTGALMDLLLPAQHINQQAMNHLFMATSTVTDKSMSLATSEVIDFKLYQRVYKKCSPWTFELKSSNPEKYATFW